MLNSLKPSPHFISHVLISVATILLAACGNGESALPLDRSETAELIHPVGRVALKMVKVEPGKRTGEEIYNAVCTSCHAAGVLGAPRTGNADDWASRIAMGFDALVASATQGKGGMPPKGGAPDLTDKEVQRVVAYLANTAGANFEAPPVE